jgi:uncharacterized protein (DUF362 family)
MVAQKSNVSLFVTDNRETGIGRCIDALGVNPVTNKNVLIKPNFNTHVRQKRLGNGNLLLAATDRVAIDAVGVAALKSLGSNQTIMQTRIFDHEQIARAVEIGIGVTSAEQVEIIPVTKDSRPTRDRVLAQLN